MADFSALQAATDMDPKVIGETGASTGINWSPPPAVQAERPNVNLVTPRMLAAIVASEEPRENKNILTPSMQNRLEELNLKYGLDRKEEKILTPNMMANMAMFSPGGMIDRIQREQEFASQTVEEEPERPPQGFLEQTIAGVRDIPEALLASGNDLVSLLVYVPAIVDAAATGEYEGMFADWSRASFERSARIRSGMSPRDPNLSWMERVLNMQTLIPTVADFGLQIVASGGLGAAAKVAGTEAALKMGATAAGAKFAGRAAAITAASTHAGVSEAVHTFDEMQRRGYTVGESLSAFSKHAVASGMLNAPTFAFLLGKLPSFTQQRMLAKMLEGGTVEAVTETLDEVAGHAAMGDFDVKSWQGMKEAAGYFWEVFPEIGPAAFLIGGGVGAIGRPPVKPSPVSAGELEARENIDYSTIEGTGIDSEVLPSYVAKVMEREATYAKLRSGEKIPLIDADNDRGGLVRYEFGWYLIPPGHKNGTAEPIPFNQIVEVGKHEVVNGVGTEVVLVGSEVMENVQKKGEEFRELLYGKDLVEVPKSKSRAEARKLLLDQMLKDRTELKTEGALIETEEEIAKKRLGKLEENKGYVWPGLFGGKMKPTAVVRERLEHYRQVLGDLEVIREQVRAIESDPGLKEALSAEQSLGQLSAERQAAETQLEGLKARQAELEQLAFEAEDEMEVDAELAKEVMMEMAGVEKRLDEITAAEEKLGSGFIYDENGIQFESVERFFTVQPEVGQNVVDGVGGENNQADVILSAMTQGNEDVRRDLIDGVIAVDDVVQGQFEAQGLLKFVEVDGKYRISRVEGQSDLEYQGALDEYVRSVRRLHTALYYSSEVVEERQKKIAQVAEKYPIRDGETMEEYIGRVGPRTGGPLFSKGEGVAEFLGWQERPGGRPPIALYNIPTADGGKTTVMAETARERGFVVPEPPQAGDGPTKYYDLAVERLGQYANIIPLNQSKLGSRFYDKMWEGIYELQAKIPTNLSSDDMESVIKEVMALPVIEFNGKKISLTQLLQHAFEAQSLREEAKESHLRYSDADIQNRLRIPESLLRSEGFKKWFNKGSRRLPGAVDMRFLEGTKKPRVWFRTTSSETETVHGTTGMYAPFHHFGGFKSSQEVLGRWGSVASMMRSRTELLVTNIKNAYVASDNDANNPLALLDTVLSDKRLNIPPAARARAEKALDTIPSTANMQEEVKALLSSMGYDGIAYENTREGEGDTVKYSGAAFEDTSLKSIYHSPEARFDTSSVLESKAKGVKNQKTAAAFYAAALNHTTLYPTLLNAAVVSGHQDPFTSAKLGSEIAVSMARAWVQGGKGRTVQEFFDTYAREVRAFGQKVKEGELDRVYRGFGVSPRKGLFSRTSEESYDDIISIQERLKFRALTSIIKSIKFGFDSEFSTKPSRGVLEGFNALYEYMQIQGKELDAMEHPEDRIQRLNELIDLALEAKKELENNVISPRAKELLDSFMRASKEYNVLKDTKSRLAKGGAVLNSKTGKESVDYAIMRTMSSLSRIKVGYESDTSIHRLPELINIVNELRTFVRQEIGKINELDTYQDQLRHALTLMNKVEERVEALPNTIVAAKVQRHAENLAKQAKMYGWRGRGNAKFNSRTSEEFILGMYSKLDQGLDFFQGSDLPTFLHEFAHAWRQSMSGKEYEGLAKWAHGKKKPPADGSWTVEAEEKFADTFVSWASNPRSKAPVGLENAFKEIAQYTTDLYKTHSYLNPGKKVSPQFADLMEQLYTKRLLLSANADDQEEGRRRTKTKQEFTNKNGRRDLGDHIEEMGKILGMDKESITGVIDAEAEAARRLKTKSYEIELNNKLKAMEKGELPVVDLADIIILRDRALKIRVEFEQNFRKAYDKGPQAVKQMVEGMKKRNNMVQLENFIKVRGDAGRRLNLFSNRMSQVDFALTLDEAQFRMGSKALDVLYQMMKDPERAMEIADKHGGEVNVRLKDLYFQAFFSGLLSSPQTLAVNTIFTGLWSLNNFFVLRPLAGAIEKTMWSARNITGVGKVIDKFFYGGDIRKRDEYVAPLADAFSGLGRAVKYAGKDALEIVKSGGEVHKMEQIKGMDIHARDITAWQNYTVTESGLIGRTMRRLFGEQGGRNARLKVQGAIHDTGVVLALPTTMMRASDMFFKVLSAEESLARLVSAEAQRIHPNNRTAQKDYFNTQMSKYRDLDNLPPNMKKQWIEEMQQIASYNTFMDLPGQVTRHLLAIREAQPITKLVIPFLNTIVNLGKRGLELTPGIGLLAEWSYTMDPQFKRNTFGHRPSDILAKQVEGMLLVAMLFLGLDEDDIIGAPPSDPKRAQLMLEQGKIPYSIRIGDRYISFQNAAPFNVPMGIIADLRQYVLSNMDDLDNPDPEVQKKVNQDLMQAAWAFASFGLNNGFMQNYGEYVRARTVENKSAVLGRTVESALVPYSGFLRWIQRSANASQNPEGYFVPNRKDTFTQNALPLTHNVINKMFGMPETDIPRLTVWGEPYHYSENKWWELWWPVHYQSASNDPLDAEVARLGYYPGMPHETYEVNGKRYRFSPDIHQQYVLGAGQDSKEAARRVVNSSYWNTVSDDRKVKLLSDAVSRARERHHRRAKAEQYKRGLIPVSRGVLTE